MRTVAEALAGVKRLAVDSAPWIYFVEKHPDYVGKVREVVRRAEEGDLVLVTSTLIQLAVAIEARCGAFLTNDQRLPSIEEMPLIQLEDLENTR